MITKINRKLLSELLDQAVVNPRLRQNLDLRNTSEDHSQRMLNALMPGTEVPIHRHPQSNETVIIISGKLIEITYDENGNETERVHLDPALGNFGCVVPAGAWHTVEVLEPSIIFEAKDGQYGQDGSETLADYRTKAKKPAPSLFSNSFGDLKKNIEYIIGMERNSGNLDTISPEYISQVLNVPLEDVKQCMKQNKIE